MPLRGIVWNRNLIRSAVVRRFVVAPLWLLLLVVVLLLWGCC